MIYIGEDQHYMSRMTSHADTPIYKKDWTDTTFTPGKAFLVVSMSILNVFMLLGNIASIVTIATSSRLRKQVSYWFVLNLAITDTFISVTVVPLNTMWEYYGIWPLGKKACEFVTFADISLSTVSAYSIVLVSIDKYIYITHAIQYHNHMTKRVALILILIVWSGVCIFSSISIFAGLASSYFEETLPNTCIYVMHDTRVVPATVITFFIPLLILSYTTSRIICIAKKHIKRIHATPSFSGTAGTLTSNDSTCMRVKTEETDCRLGNILQQKSISTFPCPLNTDFEIPALSESPVSVTKMDNGRLKPSKNWQCKGNDVVEFKQYGNDFEIPALSEFPVSVTKIDNGRLKPSKNRQCKGKDEVVFHKEQGMEGSGAANTLNQTESSVKHSPTAYRMAKTQMSFCHSVCRLPHRKYPYFKLFGTVTIVIICFILMFAPYYTTLMIDAGCHCVSTWIYEDILTVLCHIHALVNPYIYISTDRKYKSAFKQLWKKVYRRLRAASHKN